MSLVDYFTYDQAFMLDYSIIDKSHV
jgi:hypothetical protein